MTTTTTMMMVPRLPGTRLAVKPTVFMDHSEQTVFVTEPYALWKLVLFFTAAQFTKTSLVPGNCVCPLDVTTNISGLVSGTYQVNIYTNNTFAISDQVQIP